MITEWKCHILRSSEYSYFVNNGFRRVNKNGPTDSIGLSVPVPKPCLMTLEKNRCYIYFYDLPSLNVKYKDYQKKVYTFVKDSLQECIWELNQRGMNLPMPNEE